MSLLDELQALGVDIDSGKDRLMGNSSLYEKLLFNFLKFVKELSLDQAFADGNWETALEKAHSLKGVAGNLSMTSLYEAYTKIVALLRESRPDEAKSLFEKIQPAQAEILHCIEKYSV